LAADRQELAAVLADGLRKLRLDGGKGAGGELAAETLKVALKRAHQHGDAARERAFARGAMDGAVLGHFLEVFESLLQEHVAEEPAQELELSDAVVDLARHLPLVNAGAVVGELLAHLDRALVAEVDEFDQNVQMSQS